MRGFKTLKVRYAPQKMVTSLQGARSGGSATGRVSSKLVEENSRCGRGRELTTGACRRSTCQGRTSCCTGKGQSARTARVMHRALVAWRHENVSQRTALAASSIDAISARGRTLHWPLLTAECLPPAVLRCVAHASVHLCVKHRTWRSLFWRVPCSRVSQHKAIVLYSSVPSNAKVEGDQRALLQLLDGEQLGVSSPRGEQLLCRQQCQLRAAA